MSTAQEIESILFRPVASGYLYQQANPWVFGPMRRYIVNDAQKAALLAIVTPPRPVLRIIVITAIILAWTGAVGTGMWAVSGHDNPTAIDFAIMMVLILVPIYLLWVAFLQRNLRRMAPILAGAPRTQERITNRDLRRAMTNAMSSRKLFLLGSVWVFSCLTQVFSLVIRNARHPLFSDLQSNLNLFVAVLAAALAVWYLLAAVRKLRQQRAAA
jgi:hypothetical protein